MTQRINRRLATKSQKLFKARLWTGGYVDSNLGRYYIVDTHSNTLTDSHCDLVKLGRECQALAEWEELAES